MHKGFDEFIFLTTELAAIGRQNNITNFVWCY